jgi:hypothetical protein
MKVSFVAFLSRRGTRFTKMQILGIFSCASKRKKAMIGANSEIELAFEGRKPRLNVV